MYPEEDWLQPRESERTTMTMRDIVAVGFGHKNVLLPIFLFFSTLALIYAYALPPKYEATTKILVRRDRMDPMVTPSTNVPVVMREGITEEELNSEVEILLSNDVLREVVTRCGLENLKPVLPLPRFGQPDEDTKIQVAMNKLQSNLKVMPVKKTSVIEIAYRARDPELAAKVLKTLDSVYIDHHLRVHRSAGQFTFFKDEADAYEARLKMAEQKLEDFSRGPNSVRPEIVRDQMLQQLTSMKGALAGTQADIAQTQSRIRTLEKQFQSVPERMTTAVKRSDNAQLQQQLKGTLLTLQLKRNELLSKYQKSYRPVQELEQEIANTQAAIAAEEKAPLREDTTDVDPTHTMITGELVKARADLQGLLAREGAMRAAEQRNEELVHDLAERGMAEQTILRDVKAAEQDYLLYQQKREDSRITDALDERRILNVVIAEQPMVPALPMYSSSLLALAGIVFAGLLSAVVVFVIASFDSSFHVPREVESTLRIPVLASVPCVSAANGGNGHNGNGHKRNGHNGSGSDRVAESSA